MNETAYVIGKTGIVWDSMHGPMWHELKNLILNDDGSICKARINPATATKEQFAAAKIWPADLDANYPEIISRTSAAYVVRDREAGNVIERVASIEEGEALIAEYEEADRKDGTYTPDFYEVVKGE